MDISIIIPVYNVEKYLKYCLDSVISQKFEGQYEIICVNDGSMDSSLEILKEYKKNNSKINVINQENRGLSAARNAGIRNAKGKYIMFVDSDDSLKNSDVLTLLYNEAEKENLDIVVADFEYDFDDKNKNYRKKRNECIKNKVMTGRDFYDLGIKTKSIMSVVWNKLYRRDFIIKNNLFFIEGILYEDMEFTPKAYYLAERVKYIDKVIYMYRQREGSIMSNKNIDRINDYFIIADSINEFNKKFNSYTLLQAELYIYVIVIRKLKYIENTDTKNLYKLKLRERNIQSKFLHSNKVKYKIFIILYTLGVI
ncbi:glycosyltransferase [Thermoanaerobacterium thermosaccharolyticum]|uniref:glycosyltransferase n=1 Tax=Thermoanaerobacterium thermosaccharolyticum TaxID=1517 RepID=UPI003DA9ECA9